MNIDTIKVINYINKNRPGSHVGELIEVNINRTHPSIPDGKGMLTFSGVDYKNELVGPDSFLIDINDFVSEVAV